MHEKGAIGNENLKIMENSPMLLLGWGEIFKSYLYMWWGKREGTMTNLEYEIQLGCLFWFFLVLFCYTNSSWVQHQDPFWNGGLLIHFMVSWLTNRGIELGKRIFWFHGWFCGEWFYIMQLSLRKFFLLTVHLSRQITGGRILTAALEKGQVTYKVCSVRIRPG